MKTSKSRVFTIISMLLVTGLLSGCTNIVKSEGNNHINGSACSQ